MSDDGLAEAAGRGSAGGRRRTARCRPRRALAEVIERRAQQAGRRSRGVVRRDAQAHPVPAARRRQEGAARMSRSEPPPSCRSSPTSSACDADRLDFLGRSAGRRPARAAQPDRRGAVPGRQAPLQQGRGGVEGWCPSAIAAKITEYALPPLIAARTAELLEPPQGGRHGRPALRPLPRRRVGGDGPDPRAGGRSRRSRRSERRDGRRRARPARRVGGDGRLRVGGVRAGAARRGRRARRRAVAAHRVRPRRPDPARRDRGDADRRPAGRDARPRPSSSSSGASWTSCSANLDRRPGRADRRRATRRRRTAACGPTSTRRWPLGAPSAPARQLRPAT